MTGTLVTSKWNGTERDLERICERASLHRTTEEMIALVADDTGLRPQTVRDVWSAKTCGGRGRQPADC